MEQVLGTATKRGRGKCKNLQIWCPKPWKWGQDNDQKTWEGEPEDWEYLLNQKTKTSKRIDKKKDPGTILESLRDKVRGGTKSQALGEKCCREVLIKGEVVQTEGTFRQREGGVGKYDGVKRREKEEGEEGVWFLGVGCPKEGGGGAITKCGL